MERKNNLASLPDGWHRDQPAVLQPVKMDHAPPPGSIFTDEKNPNSSMTTKELQEYWRKEKQNCREVKVLFEIPSAKIVEKAFSKYVKYQIIIIQTGSFDSNVSMIERRYSDFEKLHTREKYMRRPVVGFISFYYRFLVGVVWLGGGRIL
uniref:Sorting nexin 20 n=1 Tax=Pseudonaja textilis TaxID=8673 RepID=A0A670YWX7_PSETE